MDGEVFEALLRAVLSGRTEWSKLERIEDELKDLFCDFDFSRYAQVSPGEVRARSVPWFQARSAGSQNLAGSLIHLAETARILSDWATEHKSTDSYFTTIVNLSCTRFGGQFPSYLVLCFVPDRTSGARRITAP